MFATLLGGLPRPPLPEDAKPEALLEACLALQSEHGLEPLTDGGWPAVSGDPVAAWRLTAARTESIVKAVVAGPWSSGRSPADVRQEIVGLADASCRWIEVHEPAAVELTSSSTDDLARFADAHRSLTADLGLEVHLSLAIIGGSADGAGIDTILAGAYSSLALDLIGGPDNWRLAVSAPTEVGIVCGAMAAAPGIPDGPEVLLWAANHAGASRGRGLDRVGLATAGSLAALTWQAAAAKVRRLGEAARLATASPDEQRAALDPRAVDSRSAALGRWEPRPAPARPARRRRRTDRDRT
jgi:hypothetical protein